MLVDGVCVCVCALYCYSMSLTLYFCIVILLYRRRLPIVMVRLKMAETVREAVAMVEQGHIRVGPTTVTDPAYLVSRTMEDFVTWVDSSAYKRKIQKYHDKLDDFDLLE